MLGIFGQNNTSAPRRCGNSRWVLLAGVAFALGMYPTAGCVHLEAPEEINVERHPRVDASQVPPTSSHEEARQRLAEAYGEIRHLQDRNRELEQDRSRLRHELDDCRNHRDHGDHNHHDHDD